MLKGEIIHGYKILEDFKVAGGTSKVTFAERGGKEYFIKEFLSPKYPTVDSPGSEKVKAQKRKACEEFEKHHKELNARISSKVGTGGNLVAAVDFFREGPCYFKVTEKVDVSSLTCKEISSLSTDKLLIICKSVCHSVKILHDLNIVHGDLKPDNILIKKTSAGYSGKLIDFDDSYFTGVPPKHECLVGTPEYYSPEQAAYIMDEDEEISGTTLSLKSDIFSLGIIFCEYLTGRKPLFDSRYSSTWSCVADDGKIKFSGALSNDFEEVLHKMLSLNPINRPSIGEVFEFFKGVKGDGVITGTISTPECKSLRGSGLGIGRISSCESKGLDSSHDHSSTNSTKLRIGKGLKI